MVRRLSSVVALVLSCVVSHAAGNFVWWEAEKTDRHSFPASNAFSANTAQEKGKLSGGNWLHTDKGANATAKYTVDVPADGEYAFWTRKFWKHGPFKWRWGRQPWKTCTRECALADSVELRKHLCANWVFLGKVKLRKGANTLDVKALPESTAVAFDCWLITKGSFTPNGSRKPGEKYNRAEPGWFPWEPEPDAFEDSALLDLRSLNQKRAGDDGYVEARGMDFVFKKTGEKVKFWAVNAGAHYDDHASVDFLARRLAKLGVNMVRVHSGVFDRSAADPATVNKAYLDQLHYFVSAMADAGIYTKLSFYFPVWFDVKKGYGLDGCEGKKPFSLLFFHPRMQQIYKSWAKGLLTTRNPYTGKSFAQDPAVAIVEILNEDNYFFWTFTPYKGVPAQCINILEKKFGDWLKKKHGSLRNALNSWGGSDKAPQGDNFGRGRVGIYPAGQFTSQGWAVNGRNQKRAEDTVQFLTENQRQFYIDMQNHFRNRLGVKCAISATNWTTADNKNLGALDKYTNMVCGVMDRHAYFGSQHKGEAAGYSVRKGHTYVDTTAMYGPSGLTQELQYADHPHIVSEYNYPMPNRFRAECPWLAATYGLLNGTDCFYHFAMGKADWERAHPKFSIYTPVTMGQFPATALLYREGYVREGPVVYHAAAKLADLYKLKGTPVAQPQNLDEFRKADVPAGGKLESGAMMAMDPLSFFVGQVSMDIGEDPGASSAMDLSRYIDRNDKVVKSATDELAWDWGKGVATLRSPHAQGACGFLGAAGPLELGDALVQFGSEYGTVLLVSMDGKPIKTSRKMLLQVMTEDRNYAWKTSGGTTKTIQELGAPPIVVKDIKGSVALMRGDAFWLKVTALDQNGYEREDLPGDASDITLLRDCVWYVIQR